MSDGGVILERPASWNAHNAAAFELADVIGQYHLRAPYPSSLTECLLGLAVPRAGAVLELGCGTGKIARALAPHVARVDAIDIAEPMIARARTMPGGDHPSIRWRVGRAEEAALDGPYALAVAGAALHWMDWDVVLPRVGETLGEGAVLAIVVSAEVPPPWAEDLRGIIGRYSVIRDWQNADLIALLESRGLFKAIGKAKLVAEAYERTVDEYIDGLHATSGLPRERMGADGARAFDDEVRALVAPHASDGVFGLAAGAEVDWGRCA
jgi:SAM-dependent methyltransferase